MDVAPECIRSVELYSTTPGDELSNHPRWIVSLYSFKEMVATKNYYR